MSKKTTKIISIAAITIVAVIVVAVGAVSWLLFSHSGIKAATRYAIENYAPCKAEVGDIRLTLKKTFPHFGLEIDNLVVYNEEGVAPGDTLAFIGSLIARIDVDSYRNDQEIKVSELFLDEASAWLYTGADGRSNLDIFTNGDKEKKKKEPLSFSLPDSLGTNLSFCLERLKIGDVSFRYTDETKHTDASVGEVSVNAKGVLRPDVTGDMKLGIALNGISGTIGDTAVTILNLSALSISANTGISTTVLTGNGDISISGLKMSSGGNDATSDDVVLKFDALCNTSDKLLKGTAEVTSGALQLLTAQMSALTNSLILNLSADGSYADGNSLKATLDGGAGEVSMQLDGHSPMTVSLGKLGIRCSAAGNISAIEGDADISINAGSLDFSMDGSSPITVTSPQMTLTATGAKHGSDVTLIPGISSPSVLLAMKGETYISQWPLEARIPVATDTAFSSFKLSGASISVNRQELHADAYCQMLKDRGIDADGHIYSSRLDIAALLRMLPEAVRSSLKGIDSSGGLVVDAKGRVSVKEGVTDILSAGATLTADNFYGSMNDSISAKAESIRLTANLTDEGKSCTADVVAKGLDASLISKMPVTAHLADLSVTASADNILDSLARERAIVADVYANGLDALADTISASMGRLSLSGIYTLASEDKNNEGISLSLNYDTLTARAGRMIAAHTGVASLQANARLDTTRQEFILRWKPEVSASVKGTTVESLSIPLSIPNLAFDFSLGELRIADSRIELGRSEFSIAGNVRDIGSFLDETGTMEGSIDFTSDHTDLDEILAFISGFGKGGEKAAEKIQTGITEDADTAAPAPFIVPDLMNVAVNTHIREMDFNHHRFHNLGGDITFHEGSLILQELGFSSDAAEMQLTAIYRTPKDDDIHASVDFHLLDIDINELIDLIPSVDSVVPMLKSFDGKAQFHLAVETDFTDRYEPILSTLIGATAIEGKDLKVMDNEVFSDIKKKLLMSKKAENRIDSLSVEMQVLRNRVELFPFLVHMDRYSVVVAGHHNIDKELGCKYHISVIQTPLPLRLGVNIEGSTAEIAAKPIRHIKMTKCLYDKTFSPSKASVTDQRILQMKRIISDALKANVKERPSEQE